MDPLSNAVLGVLFLVLGVAATLLMYHLWGYPFDEEKFISAAPKSLMRLHRVLGWLYVLIYLYFMWQMVPRMWNYQVEFPARTVAHLCLGISIGSILVLKITIVRFFKHLEGKLIPFLGTLLLICTVLLIGLSAPFAMREHYLAQSTVFTPENIARVAQHLPEAGFPPEARLDELASLSGLQQGRVLLQKKCIDCHDLRLVLAKPQTPENWVTTVERMADRSVITNPISEREQWHIAAYLIAVSPDIRKTFKKHRSQELEVAEAKRAGQTLAAVTADAEPNRTFDLMECKKLYSKKCASCHELSDVDQHPPNNTKACRDLVARMVENGMRATPPELEQMVHFLKVTYVKAER
jgi:mono/diheme cytochrome c family protein